MGQSHTQTFAPTDARTFAPSDSHNQTFQIQNGLNDGQSGMLFDTIQKITNTLGNTNVGIANAMTNMGNSMTNMMSQFMNSFMNMMSSSQMNNSMSQLGKFGQIGM